MQRYNVFLPGRREDRVLLKANDAIPVLWLPRSHSSLERPSRDRNDSKTITKEAWNTYRQTSLESLSLSLTYLLIKHPIAKLEKSMIES